jgi:hypothetical protein
MLRFCLILSVLSGTASGWTVATSTASADDHCLLRSNDEMWLVSTRHLGCASGASEKLPDYQVEFYEEDNGWQARSIEELLAAQDDGSLLIIYVHGNRVSFSQAFDKGWSAYQSFVRTREDDRAVRFVVWSWPSDQIRGPLRDVRSKAVRTETEGYLLGQLLARVNADQPTALIGYSFGARVVTGALHLVGGGSLSCGSLETDASSFGRARVALMAAAMHNYWLNPNCYHERAASRIAKLLNFYNPCDPVLKRYGALTRCSHPRALGFTGLCSDRLESEGVEIEQWDVSGCVGASHDEVDYQCCGQLTELVREFLIPVPPGD